MIIGIGIDAVDIGRFRAALDRTPSMRSRLFVHEELSYVEPHADPVPSLAVRFAAREAVMKSMGVGLGAFDFHDVWVSRAESGEPSLRVEGRARRLADERSIDRWHVSLTHSDSMAVAYVIAEGVRTLQA